VKSITGADRLSLTALAVGDVGVGVFLVSVGTLPGMPVLHTIVGVVSLLLALPAGAAAITGRLPSLADEGVLVNLAVLVFAVMEVVFLPAAMGQKIGLAIVFAAAALAAAGMYLRTFGVLRLPQIRGRHHDD
jgi:hypothetical protein